MSTKWKAYALAVVVAVNIVLIVYVSIGWRAISVLLEVNLDVLLYVVMICTCDVLQVDRAHREKAVTESYR